MAVLTAILTHLGAPLVERQLGYLRALAPGARFLVCHGGERADFDALDEPAAIFIDDPSLRGPHFDKSINRTLCAIHDRAVRDDPEIDYVYLVEYDHLILRADFEDRLVELAQRSGAGMLGKWASTRNDSNWDHHIKLREDERLNGFLRGISRRDDPGVRWGCLGTGMFLSRQALAAYCELPGLPELYVELMVPTVLYHLGFEIADVDALADLYTAIRWLPEFGVAEAIAAKRAGHTFVHPFKHLDRLDAVGAA